MASLLRLRRRGFTLIELLVVVALIVILAGLLFPVFAQVRAKVRQAACVSNLKQLGSALLMYVQDYDETFPYVPGNRLPVDPRVDWGKDTWVYNDVYVLLQPYVRSYQVFFCPDRRRVLPDRSSPSGPGTLVWGYGYNWSSGYGPHFTKNSLWNRGDGCVGPETLMPFGVILPGHSIAQVAQLSTGAKN